MTDNQKQRKLISSIYLEVITGDIHIKNQYMNTLITHITVYIKDEKLLPHQRPIEVFRTRLHSAISMILHNNYPLPAYDETRETEILKAQRAIEKFVIKIDGARIETEDIVQIGILEDIETLEYCRNLCYSASSDYSMSLTGAQEGLTSASNKYAVVLDKLTPIIYKYNMVEISDVEFSNAARVAAKRAEMDRGRVI